MDSTNIPNKRIFKKSHFLDIFYAFFYFFVQKTGYLMFKDGT